MDKIYSKIESNKLLHLVFRKSDFKEGRVDLSDPTEFLQASALSPSKGKIVLPHKHKKMNRNSSLTQESIIVIEGLMHADYYDLDGSKLFSTQLGQGDLTITLWGGHSFSFIEDQTKIYELKNGPYLGKEFDYEPL